MHFAIWLPDWNSLDSVRRAHSRLEGSALAFFALLVVFDVLAHLSAENKRRETLFEKIALCCFALAVLAEIGAYPYGQRNDKLSGDIISSLSQKAKQALTDSGTALTKAGEATIKAEAAGESAAKTQGKADAAKDASDSALREAHAVAKQADDLRTKYFEAENELEKEKRARDELEKTLAPRFIWFTWNKLTGISSEDQLKPFAGWSVIIRSISDVEARRAALNLKGHFEAAGWNVVGNTIKIEDNLNFFDGVTVDQYAASVEDLTINGPVDGIGREMQSSKATEAVVGFLKSNNWEARHMWAGLAEIKPNEVRVTVGFKPAPYFMADPEKLTPKR
jgi:hypothetical protein